MDNQRSVLVIGNNSQVAQMFRGRGWSIIYSSEHSRLPDVVCFTGGPDINPELYGEKKAFKTFTSPKRDEDEIKMYDKYKGRLLVGICRGGQLLNTLSGGAMWQDVNNHVNNHEMIDLLGKKKLQVTSTHHQMMIPGEDAHVLAVAHEANVFLSEKKRERPVYDTEVIWYPKTKSLCFQPHPEYSRPGSPTHSCQDYFFDLIDWAFARST